jgi:transcriptional regulator with XRE-family HTH domain
MSRREQARHPALELAIGGRIRARRRELGLTQAQLAERLGVSFQQVQKYERGDNRVAASTLAAAAAALGVTVAWLVGEDAAAAHDSEVFKVLAAPGAMDLLEAYRDIHDPRLRQALLALAREMAETVA